MDELNIDKKIVDFYEGAHRLERGENPDGVIAHCYYLNAIDFYYNQLKECREEIDRLEKDSTSRFNLIVRLNERIDTLKAHIQHDEFYAIRRTKEACKERGWMWIVMNKIEKQDRQYIEAKKASFEQTIDSVGKK